MASSQTYTFLRVLTQGKQFTGLPVTSNDQHHKCDHVNNCVHTVNSGSSLLAQATNANKFTGLKETFFPALPTGKAVA